MRTEFSIADGIDIVNDKLGKYVDEINNSLSDGYNFSPKSNHKRKIRAADILNIVVSEYFNIRPLTKDSKAISSLSSGQQRLAIIDVATTLLSSDRRKSKEIIFALDEPENSLESSHRFTQFNRLVEIAEKYNHQVFLTTHWYGLLLRPSAGRLHYIEEGDKSPKVSSYGMKSLFDQRRYFPNSIEMKSYFDLMTSMLSLLRNSHENWIICEGGEDAVYLGLYLKKKIPNLYILPFNGCGNIKKIFEFLSVPYGDKREAHEILGKVLCLIDTDSKSTMIINDYSNSRFNGKLQFSRLSFDRSKNKSDIVTVASNISVNTEIEDVLEPEIMWEAIRRVSENHDDLRNLMAHYSLKDDAKYTDLTGDMGMFNCETLPAYKNIDKLKELLHTDEIKERICKEYQVVHNEKGGLVELEWVNMIESFFKK